MHARYLCSIAALALTVLASAPALAASGDLPYSFTPPTKYTDGSTLAASDIASYTAECTFTPTNGTAVPCTFSPSSLSGTAVSGKATITYPPQGGRACVKVRTVLKNGATSDPSTSQACQDFAGLKPNPPDNVVLTITVTVNITAAPKAGGK